MFALLHTPKILKKIKKRSRKGQEAFAVLYIPMNLTIPFFFLENI